MTKRKPRKRMPIVSDLIDEGWQTPNTYDNCFATLPPSPGVYLFLQFTGGPFGGDWREETVVSVVYVGMSICIARRVCGHPILRKIPRPCYLQKWFKSVPASELRDTEREYIRRFKPTFNIIGRVPGEAWQS